ncbi:ankyrin repeat domain-containing protein 26-like isoform X9 [Cololabis saira]|uniref:ankyrin repeat domain-containing protein 26-like isoform X9 n=1 Tax=Cololabis saira TaxID=129043 RepID=UPI002AD484A7|nr:ankyrin repeat domain-containing protein 26-like isoform X9 [Cololabis saira]
MKKIFSFTKKKKHPFGTPDNGSVLSAGYDLKEKDLSKVHKAAYQGDLAKLKQLAKKNDINQVDKENRAPLHIACANGHAEVVQFLVGSRANLNLCDNQNRSALMKAVQGQHEHCVSILLENDAQPNLLDVNGNTALHLAVNIPSVSTAVLLLQHGAEINAQNKEGFTPLTVAVREDHIEMAEFLLKKEAEINCVDRDQRSPLMLAAGNGQISMVKLLLHFKADIKLKDTKGWSADDYAVMNEHHPCSLLIIDHGTQRTDGASGSHQSQNKKKKMLGSPSHDVEAGFALGGPAADKEEHGANEAGGDFEDNSQSESLSRVSKSAADEWLTSEDEDESASFEKKPLKVNLSKMIGSKKGKASELPDTSLSGTDSESENEIRVPAVPAPKALSSTSTLQHPIDPLPVPSSLPKAPQMTSTLPNYRKTDDSTEDEDNQEDEGQVEEGDISEENDKPGDGGESPASSRVPEAEAVRNNKRDFLSELGLEEGEEDQDSRGSESHSENSNQLHEEKEGLHTHSQELPTREQKPKENLFYVPSFLRGKGGVGMAELEPHRRVGRPKSSQGEGNSDNDDNQDGIVEEDETTQKDNGKAKWQPLNVLSKLEKDFDQKTDLMEDLGLGDVDDLEGQKADASDWDSASTTSKRTLPGRRLASPGLEEFPECSNLSANEEEEDAALVAPPTPQRNISSDNKPPSTPSKSAPQPHPRARTLVIQKPESEEDSDWEPEMTSSCKASPADNQLQTRAEPSSVVKPGSPEPNLMTKDSKSSSPFDKHQQELGEETARASVEVENPSVSWDSAGATLEEVNCEKPEPGLRCPSSPAGVHQEQHPVAARSANRAPVQLHLPVQQACNGKKQEKQAVEESSKPELVRGARHSRAPQTNTHVNGDPPSVFDDSSLSDMSDAEGRLQTSEQQRTKNPEDMGLAEDFDELTQSSDTATDDTDSPTSGYRHASLLIQKLDMATLDSTTIAKLQNIFHEYERSIQKARSSHGNVTDKVNQLEMERAGLKISLEESRDDKSALERSQLELKTEVTNLKFQLKNEQENRRNATMLYNTNRDKLRSMEELHQRLVQERKTLELEMRTLISNMKRLEGDHSEAQRLLAQERSARTLQENLLNTHIRKQQEIEEESKRNESKSNEALSQLTEASDRERELLQQSATLQEQLFMAKKDLERLRANSSLKENHLLEENETLKEHVEDVRRDLKLSNEAVTQTVFNCNNQLTTLKAELTLTTTRLESERHTRESLETEVELTRSQLAGALKEAELSQTAHADAEKALLREKEEQQRLKDRLTGDTATSREAVSSLSQKLAKAESDANRVENDLHRVTLQLTEKSLLLDVLQREKDQASSRAKELETALQAEKESVGRAKARQEASQERLAQAQSETMLLRQQLEEAANKGVAKERAVTDAQERFSDIVSKLRSDSEERVQLVEERNKELASKAADLRDDIYKLEEEKNERETKLRHLQQELADSLKKLSMSEASLEVNTCYRNDLEKEKTRLLKDLDRLKGKLEESEDQYVQAERRINGLKGSLDERNQEVAIAAQKLQGALSASAAADITIKQLEEAVQKLEIENARLEAGTKQQSNKIDALQKEAQEAAMLTDCSSGGGVRGRLEDLVTNLQGSKMTLEDQLNREVQKQSNLSHTAQDSQALWEEELKSRSKLGLRLAELEKEKGELTSQMEIEKKKAKKSTEQKKAIDIRLDQEMKRNTELQKEMYRQRTLLKTAKKKLRDQEAAGAEFGSPSNSLRLDLSRHSQADGAVGRMKDKVDDLQVQLEKEAYRCSQLEKLNGDLKDQVVSLRSSSHSSEQLERSKRLLEDEVLDLRRRMETAQLEQSQVEQYRREAEERVRQEIQQKLQEVNLFLQSQAASQEALDQIKAVNDAKLRSQLEQKIRELEGEVGRARSTQQDSLNQRESTRSELERYQQLYKEELRLRKSLAAKLERANGRLADANSKLLSERSRSFLTSNVTNGSLVGPSLDLSSLGSPAHYGAPLGPLNRSLNLGFSLLSPVTERPNKGVEDYLAKVQSELDRNISEELRNATAELDAAPARMSPVGSVDPLSRATQQYLEVLKKNNRL